MTTVIHASQAKALARATQRRSLTKREFDAAETELKALRARYRDAVPLGEVLVRGGVRVARKLKSTGRSFKLSAYLEAGNEVTPEMAPYVGAATPYDDWTVEVIAS